MHNIIQKIGYPIKSPDIRNSTDLFVYYESVNISRESFFDNAISVAKFDKDKEWSALCKPTDRALWDMTADTVNVSLADAVFDYRSSRVIRPTIIRLGTKSSFLPESCKLLFSTIQVFLSTSATEHLERSVGMSSLTVS